MGRKFERLKSIKHLSSQYANYFVVSIRFIE